jgi:hypothetical protein
MKEFFDIMMKDIWNENFSRREYVVYGVIVPVAFVVICLVASIVDVML